MSRFLLGLLRDPAEPMPTPAITLRLAAERGLGRQRRSAARNLTKRVGMALCHQEWPGMVRSQSRPGRVLLWKVAQVSALGG